MYFPKKHVHKIPINITIIPNLYTLRLQTYREWFCILDTPITNERVLGIMCIVFNNNLIYALIWLCLWHLNYPFHTSAFTSAFTEVHSEILQKVSDTCRMIFNLSNQCINAAERKKAAQLDLR